MQGGTCLIHGVTFTFALHGLLGKKGMHVTMLMMPLMVASPCVLHD